MSNVPEQLAHLSGDERRALLAKFLREKTEQAGKSSEASPKPLGEVGYVLRVAAPTVAELEMRTDVLLQALRQQPDLSLSDIAARWQSEPSGTSHRRIVLCHTQADAVDALVSRDAKRVFTSSVRTARPALVFMFPGLGEHHPQMARGLYQAIPSFRADVDRCCELLLPTLNRDLRDVMYNDPEPPQQTLKAPDTQLDLRRLLGRDRPTASASPLYETALAQPALFVIEYALAQLWKAWGVEPQAMIGHSLGEYVAACLSGVLSLEDALWVVAQRARLIQDMPPGGMLAVPLTEEAVQPLLNQNLSLSAINGPAISVIAGPPDALEALERQLAQRGLSYRQLRTSHAFHSHMMDAMADRYISLVQQRALCAPRIPYVSCVTGTWISAAETTDPQYWVRHTCATVRFADGIRTLCQGQDQVFLEVGPGQTLSYFAFQQAAGNDQRQPQVFASSPTLQETHRDLGFILETASQLWLVGLDVNWSGIDRARFMARTR